MVLSLREVLALPALRSADPYVLADDRQLERPVRWVHTTELADIGPLLRGGELVLTTGIAMPDSADALRAFVTGLVESGAAGLAIELGRRWAELPDSLVDDCAELGLPLVSLRREVRFASVAQAVGERLVDEQLQELRAAQRVHDTFTELSIAEAGPNEILSAVQRLSGATVVLEDGRHRILDYRAGPDEAAAFLEDWERRSRNVRPPERTAWDQSNGWLVTRVGRSERDWGRLVIDANEAPSPRLVAVAERGAAALALHRLHDRTRDSRTRRLHHELLLSLLTTPGDADVVRRVTMAGVAPRASRYVGLMVRPEGGAASAGSLAARLEDVVTACLRAAEKTQVQALVAAFESDVRVLVAVPDRQDPVRVVDRFIASLASYTPVTAAAGTAVGSLSAADRTLREAGHVLAAVRGSSRETHGLHRLEDVHVRGLLTLLADDERLHAFAARELDPLRSESQDGADLLGTTRVVIEQWGNKSGAAHRLNLSRSALYDRIARIERILDVDLGDAETRTSLHVAMLSGDVTHQP